MKAISRQNVLRKGQACLLLLVSYLELSEATGSKWDVAALPKLTYWK